MHLASHSDRQSDVYDLFQVFWPIIMTMSMIFFEGSKLQAERSGFSRTRGDRKVL